MNSFITYLQRLKNTSFPRTAHTVHWREAIKISSRPWRNENPIEECGVLSFSNSRVPFEVRSLSCQTGASQASHWPAADAWCYLKQARRPCLQHAQGLIPQGNRFMGLRVSVVLHWEWFCSLWLIWQHLQTSWSSQLGGGGAVLALGGQRLGTPLNIL